MNVLMVFSATMSSVGRSSNENKLNAHSVKIKFCSNMKSLTNRKIFVLLSTQQRYYEGVIKREVLTHFLGVFFSVYSNIRMFFFLNFD